MNDSSYYWNSMKVAFGKVAIYPVWDVEGTIYSKCEKIVCSNCISFTGPLQHKQLGQDSDGFKPDRKRPKNLVIKGKIPR